MSIPQTLAGAPLPPAFPFAADQDGGDPALQQRAYAEAWETLVSRDEAGLATPAQDFSTLGSRFLAEFTQAENERRLTEMRWLKDLRQYRGQYDPEVLARMDPRRSRAFIRKTRVKVKTVDARMVELLFPANSDRNWQLSPTPVPTVSPSQRRQVVSAMKQQAAAAMAGQGPAQGPTPGPMNPDALPDPSPEQIQAAVQKLVDEAARGMARVIDDQLTEARYKDVAMQVIHSGNVFGTGILKAPLVERKVRLRYEFDEGSGRWVERSESYIAPFVDFVPLWRWYPDMTATRLEDCRYVYERHLMTRSALLALSEKRSFAGARETIIAYVESHRDGEMRRRYHDTELQVIGDRQAVNAGNGLYEVLERWGWVSAADLEECKVPVPEDRHHEMFFANFWLLPNGEIIKAVLQPINGVTWPYHLYYYDKDETSIFAEGIPAIMRDDQEQINAAVRMILDNAAHTAGPQLEVNTRLLAPRERVDEMFPFKIWLRNGEDPANPMVRILEMPSHLPELSQILGSFEDNADEVTAIPRFAYGEPVNNGAAGTMGGMSMLMGAANIVLKSLINAFDEGVTKPFITALYRWNMQFNPENGIKGDFDVDARGAASLVAKEVRGQQLEMFAAAVANPMDAPFIKRDQLLRQRAEAMDLTDILKTQEEMAQDGGNAQQARMAALMDEIKLATMQKELERMAAEVAKTRAEALSTNVEAVSVALQAGGVAVGQPKAGPAGDEILRAAGWTDQPGADFAGPDGRLPAPAGGPGSGPLTPGGPGHGQG